jgi:Fic family protein
MSGLFEIETLSKRLKKYVEQSEALHPKSSRLIEEALIRGEFERGEISRITGMSERTARRVLNDVLKEGLLASTTPKGPVSLRFPTGALETLFPRLYVQT